MTTRFDPGPDDGTAAPVRICLAPALNSAAATDLAAELLSVRGRPVVLDAGAVEQLGGLCLQVLLSASRTWAADNVQFAFNPASQAIRDQSAVYGADLFSDPVGAVA
jgi:chemotaxis protein CheX